MPAKVQRRQFTAEYRRRILREADACKKHGTLGALPRREGLHSSHLVNWRRQREQGEFVAGRARKRGSTPKPVDPRVKPLEVENRRLQRKTHLGVRGLRLEADPAPRLGRLLLARSLAYILAILLGAGPLAADVRAYAEVLRPTPRHGTRRRLGALTIGILALSLGRFVARARDELDRILAGFADGVSALEIAS